MRQQRAHHEIEPLLASTPRDLVMAAPVRLVVLPIAEITAAGDLFACKPLGAKLAAGACVARQRAADPAKRREASPGERAKMGPLAFLGTCEACPDGEFVARRLAAPAGRASRRLQPVAAPPMMELTLAQARHVAAALLAYEGTLRTDLQRLTRATAGARVRRTTLEHIASATGVTLDQVLAGQGPDGAPLPHLDVARPPPRRVVRPAR